MKNFRLLLIICVISATKGLAQDKAPSHDNGYIAISIGPSIPIGDFASKDADNDKAGLAQTGGLFDISFAYKFGKYLGVSGLLRTQAYSADKQVIVDAVREQLPGNVAVDVQAGNWVTGAFMAGGYGSFPISNKASFDTRLMIGAITADSPSLDIYINGGGGSAWTKQENVTSSALAYLVGVGFKFNVGKRICILANADYMAATLSFENAEIVSSDGSLNTTSWDQPFGSVNIGVGVGYKL